MKFKGGPNDKNYRNKVLFASNTKHAAHSNQIMKDLETRMKGSLMTKELLKNKFINTNKRL